MAAAGAEAGRAGLEVRRIRQPAVVERRRHGRAAGQRLHREKLRRVERRDVAMNYTRIVAAAVAATVVDAIYGFLVYGTLLANEFARFPGVYRSNEGGMAYPPLVFVCVFVGMPFAASLYANGTGCRE